jgi:ribonuclease R
VVTVAIADVAAYVRPGTALDREAYARGTSVYLVDKVVPMLPEVLSNGLCSLVPGEDRLAFSVFLTFDASGACVARRFAKTVIRSKARFTYDEVLAVLEARKDAPALKPGARRTLRAIGALAAQLRQRTQAAGALDMDVPEAEVVLDETGMMRGITVRAYDAAHQMIEACMVAANEAVAAELWSRGVKILARFHAPPDREKCEELRAGLAKLGFSCGDLSRPKHLAKFLRKIKGDPLENVVSVMVLRSLKRALYSAKDMGHYGLAKKFYAHFTSPIRRYPDLVLHRQLASFLAGRGGRLPMAYLARAALHSSEREQVADEASRALVEIKKYRYLAACGEQTFEAVVVRCMPHGCYVEIPALAVSGLVHISRLSSHYVRYDAFLERLADATRTWKVGDAMTVCVAHVDFDARQIDFVPAQEPRRRRGRR